VRDLAAQRVGSVVDAERAQVPGDAVPPRIGRGPQLGQVVPREIGDAHRVKRGRERARPGERPRDGAAKF